MIEFDDPVFDDATADEDQIGIEVLRDYLMVEVAHGIVRVDDEEVVYYVVESAWFTCLEDLAITRWESVPEAASTLRERLFDIQSPIYLPPGLGSAHGGGPWMAWQFREGPTERTERERLGEAPAAGEAAPDEPERS